jgi:arabinofuranosyltransferase
LADLQRSVRDPLTFGRFWANLTGAAGRTTLVVPADPFAAEREFCR